MKLIARYAIVIAFSTVCFISLRTLLSPTFIERRQMCMPKNKQEDSDSYQNLLKLPKLDLSLETWYVLQKRARDLPMFNQLNLIPGLKNPCFWVYHCHNAGTGLEQPPW